MDAQKELSAHYETPNPTDDSSIPRPLSPSPAELLSSQHLRTINMARNGFRLVSFDGGGARSLSQLRIIHNTITRLQSALYPGDQDKVVLPCECFDLMGGSDTGAAIAIMLSRLRMSVEAAIEEFLRICNEVYVDGLPAAKRTSRLRKTIEELLTRRGFPVDLKLGRDARVAEDGCPCFAVTALAANLKTKVLLRSYRIPTERASDVTVVEAILATCAIQPNFLPISIGPSLSGKAFVGGAMGSGNPTPELVSEAYNLFGKDAHFSMILSLGSGRLGALAELSTASKEESMILQHIVTGCEQAAQEVETQVGHLGIYHRFSVEQGLQRIYGVDLNDISWLNSQVDSYLDDAQVSRKLGHCVENLRLRQGQSTLKQLKHSLGVQPVYEGIPPLTPYFVMRKDPWEKMIRGLINEDAEQEDQKIMVISGMGGCGKTQLVIRFTKEFKSRFKFVFFVDGSTRENIETDLINHLFPKFTWMIVCYNANNVKVNLSSFIPEYFFGTIIITTRTHAHGELASPSDLHIQLDVMSPEEAIETIFLSANMEQTDDTVKSVKAVAEELGNLPMALVQAGLYMRQNECSCEKYLDRLHRRRAEMTYTPAGDRLQRSAYHAFDLSLQQLPPFVRHFLHIIGCLHYAKFPMKAIAIAAKAEFSFDQFSLVEHDAKFEESVETLKSIFCPDGSWNDHILDNIVTALENHSLASFTRTPRSLLLQMPPLMHQWTLVHVPPERQASYRLAASRLLACSYNEDMIQQYLTPHVDALIPQLPDSPIAIYDKATFGHVLRKMYRFEDAHSVWASIYNEMIDHYGDQDLRVARAGIELADASTNDLAMMEKLEKQAISIRERVLGPDHLETLEAQGKLAGTYECQGRLEEAEQIRQRVMGKMKVMLGPTHNKSLESMHHLGQIYYYQGRQSDAEPLQQHVLKIRKERLGDTHPDTLMAMHNLAMTYHSQGCHEDAELLQQHVLKTRREQLGDTHPDTLSAMRNLASAEYITDPNLSVKRVTLRVKLQTSSTVTNRPLIGRWLPGSQLEAIECQHLCVYQPILTKQDLDHGWRSLGQSLDGTRALVVKEFWNSDPILEGLSKPDANALGSVTRGHSLSKQFNGHVDHFCTYYPETPQYHALGSHFSTDFRNDSSHENGQIDDEEGNEESFCSVRSDLLESGEFISEPLCLGDSPGDDRIFVWRIAPSTQDVAIPTMDLQLFQATETEQQPTCRPMCLRSDRVIIANPHCTTPVHGKV